MIILYFLLPPSLGTNDFFQGANVTTAISRLHLLLDTIFVNNKKVQLYLAQIIDCINQQYVYT